MKLWIFVLCPFFIYGLIIETPHFQKIEEYIDENALIILDIDDTLLIPVQMLGCDEWFLSRLRHYQDGGMAFYEALEKSLAEWEAIRHLTQMEIVEPGTDEIIYSLQNQGKYIIGLTTQGLALATRTFQQLRQNGIDLSISSPCREDHFLTQNGHGILFRHGILFSSGTHKGEALFQFFEKIQYEPKKIIFLNDKETHLREVERSADQRGVEFIGLRYSYSDARKAAFCPHLAAFQFSHSTFDHLLSDDEAREMMKNQLP